MTKCERCLSATVGTATGRVFGERLCYPCALAVTIDHADRVGRTFYRDNPSADHVFAAHSWAQGRALRETDILKVATYFRDAFESARRVQGGPHA